MPPHALASSSPSPPAAATASPRTVAKSGGGGGAPGGLSPPLQSQRPPDPGGSDVSNSNMVAEDSSGVGPAAAAAAPSGGEDYGLPSPQSVGREFVRQYYTLLNRAPLYLHRFYSSDSSFVHGGIGSDEDDQPVKGQQKIHEKIMQLNFRKCHAKIRQVDAQRTLDNGVVVQVRMLRAQSLMLTFAGCHFYVPNGELYRNERSGHLSRSSSQSLALYKENCSWFHVRVREIPVGWGRHTCFYPVFSGSFLHFACAVTQSLAVHCMEQDGNPAPFPAVTRLAEVSLVSSAHPRIAVKR